MKHAIACRQCRIGKRKCRSALDAGENIACEPCQYRKIKCSKAQRASAVRCIVSAQNLQQFSTEGSGALSPLPIQVSIECVRLYMNFIHDRPHSLFHEKTLWKDISDGTVPECLLIAICSIGCRFSTDPDISSLGARLRIRSSTLFSQQLEIISVSNIQTCVLLANLYAADEDNKLEALYFGIANRMAQVLRLCEFNDRDTAIQREINCRVWWTLFMADRWCPPALGLQRSTPDFDNSVQLPMDEAMFQAMEPSTESREFAAREGVWKYSVLLANILGPIHDLNQSIVRNLVDRQSADQQVSLLSQRLNLWQGTLPTNMVSNDDNLSQYRSIGQGGTFVALHLGYHHYSTILYFQYLDASSTTILEADTDMNITYAQKCRHHALSFSRLLHYARTKDDCHVVYLTVAHMTLVSSAVLLHMLLYSDQDSDVQVAHTQLTRNFEALVELKRYWPHLDSITHRLLTFQELCLRSSSTNDKGTHKMDQWMIRFLVEHALPLEEKKTGRDVGGLADDNPDPWTPTWYHDIDPCRTSILNDAFADLGVVGPLHGR